MTGACGWVVSLYLSLGWVDKEGSTYRSGVFSGRQRHGEDEELSEEEEDAGEEWEMHFD